MSAEPSIASVEANGFTITSNTSNAETLEGILNPPKEGAKEEPADLSKAASELGKAGGKAAAEKRQKAKEEAEEASEKKAAPKQDAEPESEEAPEPAAAKSEEEKPGNPRHDPKARMLEATRKEAEAKREAKAERDRREALERELEALRRERAPQPKEETPAAAPTDDDPEPQEGDFDIHADFVKEAAKWAVRQQHRELEAKAAEQAEADRKRSEVRESIHELTKSLSDAMKADPAFRGKLRAEVADLDPSFVAMAQGVRPTGRNWIMDQYLSAPTHAPALMLHFSEHDDDFQRISALTSPRAVTWELALIAAAIAPGTEAATADISSKPEVSKAPPPVRSVTGAPSTVPVGGYKPGMDFDAWLKANPRKVTR